MVKKLKTRRRYSESFKKARVKDFEAGTFTVSQLSRLYGVGENVLYRWIHRYGKQGKPKMIIVESSDSPSEKLRLLEQKIAELERLLGQKQIKIDYYECFLEELKNEGIDVEKKSGSTRPSSDLYDAPKQK